MQGFADRLHDAVTRTKTPVLVGLDPRLDQLPASLRPARDDRAMAAAAFSAFCRGVIEVVAPLVPAVKPQAAFFEQLGPPGMQALAEVIAAARDAGLLVVLDGKRNDIGTTAAAYAEAYLGRDSAWGADALTVSPYLGSDSLTPFVETGVARDAGIFVLVKTSNPGGGQFQDLGCPDKPLYARVGAYVEELAAASRGTCGYGAVGAVVGATYPRQLAELRRVMPSTWLLVPGYGAQGGGAADVAPAFDARGTGALVNNSRGIIFAHRNKAYAHLADARWQDAVAASTRAMIDELAGETLAGQLRVRSTRSAS